MGAAAAAKSLANGLGIRMVGIDQLSDPRNGGDELVQQSPSRFAARSETKKCTPVALPPGRARLATSPSFTGSSVAPKTMGMVAVAAFAARAGGVVSANDHGTPDGAPVQPPSLAVDHIDPRPNGTRPPRCGPRRSPPSARPWRNLAAKCAPVAGEPPPRTPMSGIPACALTASGHAAAAPPSSVTTSRRLMLGMGAPSQVPPLIISVRNRPA